MSKARVLATIVSAGNPLADGQINADLLDGNHASAFLTIPVVTVLTAPTSAPTATSGNQVLFCNTTSNTITVMLPTAVDNSAQYILKKTAAANSMVINTTSSQTIDGSTSATITVENTCLTLISDGTNWRII